MSIVRIDHNKQNPFVMINKKGLEDEEISWAAKGLWAYLLSKPNDWKVSVAHLSKIYKDKGGGEKAIYTLLNELIKHGYCIRFQENTCGGFQETIYTIMEFKNKVPHSPQADARDADAPEGSHTNNESRLMNENNKQQTKMKEKVAIAPVAVFSCLKEIKISQAEKEWICSNYTEEIVVKAVNYSIHKDTKIKTTLAQVIKWACKMQPDVPIDKASLIEDNRKLAEDFAKRAVSNVGSVECFYNKIMVFFKSCANVPPFIANFDMPDFKNKLLFALDRFGIKLKEKVFC
jgi:hypothetical protein